MGTSNSAVSKGLRESLEPLLTRLHQYQDTDLKLDRMSRHELKSAVRALEKLFHGLDHRYRVIGEEAV